MFGFYVDVPCYGSESEQFSDAYDAFEEQSDRRRSNNASRAILEEADLPSSWNPGKMENVFEKYQ